MISGSVVNLYHVLVGDVLECSVIYIGPGFQRRGG
jgi:hypothetical protein